jgi:hypothetical protein
MGQHKFSAFNKWNKLWVAEFGEKKLQSSFPGLNRLKQQHDGSQHWGTAFADFIGDF